MEQSCWYEVSVSPICAGFTCKFDCWVFAKVNKAKVRSHKCLGKGYKIKCLCQLCKNKLYTPGLSYVRSAEDEAHARGHENVELTELHRVVDDENGSLRRALERAVEEVNAAPRCRLPHRRRWWRRTPCALGGEGWRGKRQRERGEIGVIEGE
uniref:Uncharacterized protein n=1 Tax=Oryza punctata TaxID=4537 RepID=A0A0E0LSY2_ORYPU